MLLLLPSSGDTNTWVMISKILFKSIFKIQNEKALRQTQTLRARWL